MKRPSPLLRRGADVDMNSTMTPMIDVVFLLLVFFVWTASFQLIEKVLDSPLSAQMGSDLVEQPEEVPEEDFEKIIVKIGYDGTSPTWKINGEPVADLNAMKGHLSAVAEVKNDANVIVDPDDVVPLGHVIEAYDTAKTVGFQTIAFAVDMNL